MGVYLKIITYHFHRTILEWLEKMHKDVGSKKNNLKIYTAKYSSNDIILVNSIILLLKSLCPSIR